MPRVSAIVPNYNHARYLDERIGSVLNQTYENIEVLLLDDASSDNSREIFAHYANDPRVRVILNEANSGSVFRQWNKGMREAKGEYIWIAESDDSADSRLLETLVAKLDEHPTAGMAFCQTRSMNEAGETLRIVEDDPRRIGKDRWKRDFFNTGLDECLRYALYTCTIVNAGAVVFRKSVAENVGYADESWRVSGDWVFYLKMLMAADVAYVAEPLNYLRIHSGSVGDLARKNGVMIEEAYRVMQWAATRVDIDEQTLEQLRRYRFHSWAYNSEDFGFPLSANLAIHKVALAFDPYILGRIIKYLPLRPVRRIVRPLVHRMRVARNA